MYLRLGEVTLENAGSKELSTLRNLRDSFEIDRYSGVDRGRRFVWGSKRKDPGGSSGSVEGRVEEYRPERGNTDLRDHRDSEERESGQDGYEKLPFILLRRVI